MNNTVIEINFPMDPETEEALAGSDPEILIARMKNLTGGEIVVQIIIGTVSAFGAEVLKAFIIEKMKGNKSAQVKIDNVNVQNNYQQVNVVLDSKVNDKKQENGKGVHKGVARRKKK